MEKFTKEFYLENRQKKRYNKQAFFFGPDAAYKFSDLIQNSVNLKKNLRTKKKLTFGLMHLSMMNVVNVILWYLG